MRTTTLATLTIIATITCVACATTAKPTSQAEKEADIRTLIELTGGTDLARQMFDAMIDQYRASLADVPDDFWVRFREKADFEDLQNRMIPIYDAHFSHDDIEGLIAFYRTPLGEKTVGELPAVMQESMAAGLEWGQELGRRIAFELQASGYEPASPPSR